MGQEAITIYAILDPRSNAVRYVGKAVKLNKRISGHLKSAKDNVQGHTYSWIRSIIRDNLLPEFITLEIVNEEDWIEAEQFWIAYFKFLGARLTNKSIGGDGPHGCIPSEDTRAKMSKAQKGRKHTEETKIKMSVAKTGVIVSEATKKKLRDVNLGKKHTPEAISNMRGRTGILHSQYGVVRSDAQKAQHSEYMSGPNGPNWGKECSVETRKLLSEIHQGANGYSNKLTEEQVKEILELWYSTDMLQHQIPLNGVSYTTIRDILKRRTWKYLDFYRDFLIEKYGNRLFSKEEHNVNKQQPGRDELDLLHNEEEEPRTASIN